MFALCLGLALSPLLAAQERQFASDADLRSAYCTAVLQAQVSNMENVLREHPPAQQTESDRKVFAPMANDLAEQRDDLSRLRAYLDPKVKYVDAVALSAAQRRGETDYGKIRTTLSQCGVQCEPKSTSAESKQDPMACFDRCFNQNATVRRTAACHPVTWLPF